MGRRMNAIRMTCSKYAWCVFSSSSNTGGLNNCFMKAVMGSFSQLSCVPIAHCKTSGVQVFKQRLNVFPTRTGEVTRLCKRDLSFRTDRASDHFLQRQISIAMKDHVL